MDSVQSTVLAALRVGDHKAGGGHRDRGCGLRCYDKHLHSPSQEILGEVVDHLTTNHTHFWREAAHFDLFTQVVLPEAIRRHRSDRDLRVWCAEQHFAGAPFAAV